MVKRRNIITAVCAALCITLSGCGKQCSVKYIDGFADRRIVEEQSVMSGKKLEPPAVSGRDRYSLLGWFKDNGYTEKWDVDNYKVDSDITLYAAWDKNTGDEIAFPDNDKDFKKLKTPGSQEAAFSFRQRTGTHSLMSEIPCLITRTACTISTTLKTAEIPTIILSI